MSNNISNYTQAALLNSLFGKTSNFGSLTSAPTLYLALLTAAPNNASTGSTIVEANYTGYARKSTTAADWASATGSSPTTTSNANVITFAPCTAGSSTVTHFALCDASTGGNMILWGVLTGNVAISASITPSWGVGTLQVQAD